MDNKISRRAALTAAGIVGIGAYSTQALGQPSSRQEDRECNFAIKRLSSRTPITLSTLEAARQFQLGEVKLALKLDTERAFGIVRSFKLSSASAQRLKRTEQVVECAALPISDEDSIKAIREHMRQVKVPAVAIGRNTSFFFIRAAQRQVVDPATVLLLSKPHKILAEQNFILALTNGGRGLDFSPLLLFPLQLKNGRRVKSKSGSWLFLPGFGASQAADNPEPPPPPQPVPSDDTTKDFAACYGSCMKEVPDWLLGIIGGFCTACTGAIAASLVPGAQPVSVPVLVAACAGCGVAVGVVLGNCLLQCHEMLGQD
ncbi:hypothetical protein H6F89_29645 [Cyanobacteria bacterium FACHB-63]|nr:hypothetical protein [Cyanobacteria bacterium FACHB-63]